MALFNFWRKKPADAAATAVREIANKRIAELLEMQADEQDDWQKVVEKNLTGPVSTLLSESTDGNIVNTRSEGIGWEILGSAYKGHVGADQQVMIAMARRFFRFDPNAQAAIYGIVEYLMGRGLTITPKSKDPRIWKLWRNFWTNPDNKMEIRQFEIVKRWARDGEVLLRFFTQDLDKKATPFTIVRFLDPIDLRRGTTQKDNNTDQTSQGIVFDPDDAERPIAYYFRKRNEMAQEDKIDAKDVLHVKFPVADMDQSRGESALQSIMDLFTHYKQWLKNRIILNKLRTAIFAVREIDMSSSASVSALAQTIPNSARSGDNENKKQNIRPGTMYTPPPGVKMRMESANINASDVKEDGRNIILQMAAGSGLPEYMFGDASNANFASTQMAESPFVKRIEFLQSYLEVCLWKPLYRHVIQAAVDAGKLTPPDEEDIFADPDAPAKDLTEADAPAKDPAKADPKNDVKPDNPDDVPDDLTDDQKNNGAPISESELEIFYGCDIEWPEIIHRDPKEQTDALVLARNEGWVSDKTCSEKLGFDYAEEVRKQQQIEEEAEAAGNPLLQHAQDQAAADAEALAGINQQKKETDIAGAGAGK